MLQIRLKAEMVLHDCKHAIADYNLDLQAHDLRIKWLSIVTLLRAVGHVLVKVDSKPDSKLKDIIQRKFNEINSNTEKYPIYHEFIKKERDRFLKEYEHGIIRIVQTKLPKSGKGFTCSSDVSKNGAYILPKNPDIIKSYIASGQFKGIYERDIAVMAYKWWLTIIDEIKDELNKVNFSEKDSISVNGM